MLIEGLGGTEITFDPEEQKIKIFSEKLEIPPNVSWIIEEPVYVWQATQNLPNAKQILLGNAISQTFAGPSEFSFDVLFDNSTIGVNSSNQLYLMEGAVSGTKISTDSETGDQIIRAINNATTEVIDGSMLPDDIVYLSTATATGDISGTYNDGFQIGEGAVSGTKISTDSETGDQIIRAMMDWNLFQELLIMVVHHEK